MRALLPLALVASPPLATTSGGCGDAAADNYDPSSVTPPGDNSACVYLCAKLLARFELEPGSGECWIDAGSDQRWPPAPVEPLARSGKSCTLSPGHGGTWKYSDCDAGQFCIYPGQTPDNRYCSAGNNTYTVPSWTATKAVVIQGHALGPRGQGATPLLSRVVAVEEGTTLVLRHVNMSGLVAVSQPKTFGRSQDPDGGAVYISDGVLTVEHAAFHANSAGRVSRPSPRSGRRC